MVKLITAAVFLSPEMSRQMVRQDWSNWKLDIALPMLYHNFYRQNLEWIKFSTRTKAFEKLMEDLILLLDFISLSLTTF